MSLEVMESMKRRISWALNTLVRRNEELEREVERLREVANRVVRNHRVTWQTQNGEWLHIKMHEDDWQALKDVASAEEE